MTVLDAPSDVPTHGTTNLDLPPAEASESRFAILRTFKRHLWLGLPADDRRRLVQALLATAVGSLATATIPIIVALVVDRLYINGTAVQLTHAIVPLLLLLATTAVINAAEVIRHQKVHTVTTGFEVSARKRIYAAILRWPMDRFRSGTDGAIYGRANRGVEGAVRLIKLGSADLLPAVLVAAFSIVLASVRFGALGLVMALVIPTGFGLVTWQIKSQRGIRTALENGKADIDGLFTAYLALVKVTRTSGTEGYVDREIGERVTKLGRTELKHHIAMSLFDAGKAVNETLWLLVTVSVAIGFGLADTPGDFAGMVLIYLAICKPLRELHRVLDEGSEASVAARRLVDDLEAPEDPSYSPAIGATTTRVSAPVVQTTSSIIEFAGVSYAYPVEHQDEADATEGREPRPVLNDVSVSIATGQRVGIVGPSGCGKSTFLDMVPRLHHDYAGQIRLQGRPLSEYSRKDLKEVVGYVGQEPTLFPGTVRDNLLMGRDDLNDADLDEACRKASVLDDIGRMVDGYDSKVAQKGGNLSGGQRQRLCIARALLHTPPVMLLDEPTSALDGASESAVQGAIDALTGVTMLIVAHRLSTLKNADRILVFHEGRIVEDGTYDQLAAQGGAFSAMLANERWNG